MYWMYRSVTSATRDQEAGFTWARATDAIVMATPTSADQSTDFALYATTTQLSQQLQPLPHSKRGRRGGGHPPPYLLI